MRAEPALYQRPVIRNGRPAASAALIAEAIGAGEPAVICAHRENSLLQAAAIGALGPPDGTLLPREWADELPTAGFWVLHADPAAARAATARVRATAPVAVAARAPAPTATTAGSGGGALVAADRYDLSDA